MTGMDIRIDSISFSYKKKRVLNGITQDIPSGSICFLLGENGAGKSTLLKCINYVLKPDSGSIFAGGENVRDKSIRERARIFGYVPQSSGSGSSLNVIDTVATGMVSNEKNPLNKASLSAVAEIIDQMDLGDLSMRRMNSLSGGERQRVLIARALAQKPRIMLLDEPTNNLDLRYQLETMALLYRISRDRGITVVAVIHDLNLALMYADSILVLKNGQVRYAGDPVSIVNEDAIREIYGVESWTETLHDTRIVVPHKVL